MIGAIASHYVAAAASTYSTEVLADSPLAYWRFGETSGTSAADSSGNGRNGTYNGPTLGVTGLLTGDTNKAASFDGTNDYMRIADAAWMDVTTVTLEALVKLDVISQTQNFIDRDGGVSNRAFQFRMASTNYLQLIFWTVAGGPHICTGVTPFVAGTRYHVAATFDGTTAKVYLNGVEDGSLTVTTSNMVNVTRDLSVGCYTAGESGGVSASFVDGVIDEPAMYGSALSAARIAAHYAAA